MTFDIPPGFGPDETRVKAESEDPVRQLAHEGQASAQPWPGPSLQTKPGKHLATQTQYPWRTSIRTGVATFVLFLGAVAAISADPTVGAFLSAHFPDLLPRVLAIGAICGALAGVIKRIGSIPQVAQLFVRLGLGVIPKSALKS